MLSQISYFFIMALAGFLSLVPIPVSTWIACRVGDFVYFVFINRRKTALENIEKAFGDSKTLKERKQIARKSFQNMAISATELFIIRRMKKEADKRFELVGAERIHKEIKKGRGIVLVSSHLGSWEYLSFLMYFTHIKLSAIVKDMKDSRINYQVDLMRQVTGLHPIPKKYSVKETIKKLEANEMVAILIDQWAGWEGVWQDFFDSPTSTTAIPARFALRQQCSLVPAYCMRISPGHYRIEVHEPIIIQEGSERSEEEITLQLNQLLEAQIRKYPEQWLWMHRRWKSKPKYMRNEMDSKIR